MKYIVTNTKGLDGIGINEIGKTDNVKEVNKIINAYINNIGFKSYYWRTLMYEDINKLVIDYGSYIDFISIQCDSEESYRAYLDNN